MPRDWLNSFVGGLIVKMLYDVDLYKTEVFLGDSREVLKQFPDKYFNLIVTSPPYADARKKHYESIPPEKYADFILDFHEQFWRVLADDGSFILNIKDKIVNGIRHRFVWHTIEGLFGRGWLPIDDYLWIKPNAMPGFWNNRLRDEWEYCFHLTKQRQFAMYQDAVRKPVGTWVTKRLAKLNGKVMEGITAKMIAVLDVICVNG